MTSILRFVTSPRFSGSLSSRSTVAERIVEAWHAAVTPDSRPRSKSQHGNPIDQGIIGFEIIQKRVGVGAYKGVLVRVDREQMDHNCVLDRFQQELKLEPLDPGEGRRYVNDLNNQRYHNMRGTTGLSPSAEIFCAIGGSTFMPPFSVGTITGAQWAGDDLRSVAENEIAFILENTSSKGFARPYRIPIFHRFEQLSLGPKADLIQRLMERYPPGTLVDMPGFGVGQVMSMWESWDMLAGCSLFKIFVVFYGRDRRLKGNVFSCTDDKIAGALTPLRVRGPVFEKIGRMAIDWDRPTGRLRSEEDPTGKNRVHPARTYPLWPYYRYLAFSRS